MTGPADRPVLGFDTSGPWCAAAIVCGGAVLVKRHEEWSRGQAERLMPLLQDLLADAGTDWADLAAIGVGIGPGNFTGIRISVAAARGLALSLTIPAIGVSGMQALAHGIVRPCIASLPAPRGAAYIQVFDQLADHAPRLLSPSDRDMAMLPKGACCVGHDAAAIAGANRGTVATGSPVSVSIAMIAQALLDTPQPRPTPLYLRPADAAPGKDRPPELVP